MKLLDFLNGEIVPRDELFTITIFKKLYDSRKDKDLMTKELSWIYLMSDFFSDFYNITDEDERSSEICEKIDLPKKWKEDKLLKDCRSFYVDKHETATIKLAKSAQHAATVMATYLDTLKIEDVSDFAKITTSLKSIKDNIKALDELDEMMRNKSGNESKIKGKQEKSLFEDIN